MPELKLYTVAQLRDWVMHNRAVEGLSEKMVSRTRAYALVNNPYVKDEDSVVAAIFIDGENVAYVTSFPEKIGDNRYWWFSALWCSPKYEGNGYGLIVIGSLAEEYGVEFCLDRWGANETVEIFTYLGHKTVYTPRYSLGVHINRDTTKGKCIYQIRKLQTRLHRAIERYRYKDYSLRYLSYIDAVTYAFICAHRSNDYLHHTQAYLNWGLQYSYIQSTPLIERVSAKMPFSQSELPDTQMYAVEAHDGDTIIGFYIMKKKDESLHILYLFYDETHKNQVFASIRDHVKQMKIGQCVTENEALAEFLQKEIYFPKRSVAEVSFSTPNEMTQPRKGQVQYGDGDCLMV